MSNSEKKSLEAYPPICTTGKYGARVDWNETKREAYQEGYEQAIKDAVAWMKEREWDDVVSISSFEDGMKGE